MYVRIKNKVMKMFRRNILQKTIKRQPYSYNYEDIKIVVEKNVFPPDIGFASLDLIETIKLYKAKSGLDMGAGTGIIALAMKKFGIGTVVAVDNHLPAVECCKHNFSSNLAY